MKKKVILYNPKAVFFDMPLALLAIGSQVCDEYEVIIIDARIEKDPIALLKENIESTIAVGVTSLTGMPLKDAIFFSQQVKRINTEIPVIWGGWHTSLFPKQILRDIQEVDIAVVGQGEETFKELLMCIKGERELPEVSGIVFRSEENTIQTPPRTMTDMNEFSRLNYDLIDVEKYFEAKGVRQFDFIASTGCFFRCTFCADPFVFNRKYTGLLAERMYEDLVYYHKKYQFVDVNFQDETFFTYPKRIIELAEKLKIYGPKFTWAATMRADQGSRMSMEAFEVCKQSGLRRLLIGVESGSQEMMDWLKKDIKMEQVLLCAKRCKELGIRVIFPFIVGFPKESDQSVIESQKMIRQLSYMSSGFETPIFYFKPYPGTKITDEAVEKGEYQLPQTIEEWSEFDYIGSKGPWVNDEKFYFFERYKFYLKLYSKREQKVMKPLTYLAKKRIDSFNFSFPFEKFLIEKIAPKKELS